VSSDAITLLKADHREIRRLFREYHRTGPRAVKAKARLVNQIIELLTVHTYVENEVVYPQVREMLPQLEDDVLESYEEHHVADVLCAELAAMKPEDERFDAKTTVLIENVTHHIKEEEDDWFPKVRSGLRRKQLRELGTELEAAKQRAPRNPAQPSAMKKAVDAVLP
jgi:hemerythrin superfamily protein